MTRIGDSDGRPRQSSGQGRGVAPRLAAHSDICQNGRSRQREFWRLRVRSFLHGNQGLAGSPWVNIYFNSCRCVARIDRPGRPYDGSEESPSLLSFD